MEFNIEHNLQSNNTDEIEIMIRARYPIIYIVSWEERRVEIDLLKIATKLEKKLFSWSITQGLVSMNNSNKRVLTVNDSTRDPLLALENIERSTDSAIYIIKDIHNHMGDYVLIRKLRDLAMHLRTSYKTLVFLSPTLKIPQELEKDISIIDYKLPSINDLEELLDKLINSIQNARKNVSINLDSFGKEKLLQAALGLTLSEAENVLGKAIVSKKRIDVQDIHILHEEKKQIIRKTGLLEFYPTFENLTNVGGLNNLKIWLRKRSSAFTEKARDYGLPQPKGIMLLGVSGSGKSLVAKAVSSLWHLPLLRLDIGNVFSGLVGSSEENMRKAIKASESVAPCLLWVDELDKSLSGSASSNFSDGGTTARVLSSFLTWMQEKTSPVFIIATANDISNLPPELLRKGRFDEIFFLDLPNKDEREEIFVIHLRKRNRNPDDFDIELLSSMANGFSGAEIEQAIISAMYDSFEEDRELLTSDIVHTLNQSVPLYYTMRENIDNLKQWAKTRARGASSEILDI